MQFVNFRKFNFGIHKMPKSKLKSKTLSKNLGIQSISMKKSKSQQARSIRPVGMEIVSKEVNQIPLPDEILDYIFKSFIPLETQQNVRSVSKQFQSILPDIRLSKDELYDLADQFNDIVFESILFQYPQFIQHVHDNTSSRFILLNPERTQVLTEIIVNKTPGKPMKIIVKREPDEGDRFIKTVPNPSDWIHSVAKTIDKEILNLVLDYGEDYVYIFAEPSSSFKNFEQIKSAMKNIILDKINDPNYIYPFDSNVSNQVKNELNAFLNSKIDQFYKQIRVKALGKRMTEYEKREYLRLIVRKLQEFDFI